MATRLRRWHRRLALVIGAFLIVQGLTGAVSQYRFWLMGKTSPEVFAVTPDGDLARPGEIIAAIGRAAPEFDVAHVMYPAANAPGTAVMAMGRTAPNPPMSGMVTVDPYTVRVVHEGKLGAGWIGLANSLHKWTVFGTSGRVLLTLFGLAVIALAVLGILLHFRTRRFPRQLPTLNKVHRYAGLATGCLLLIVASTGTTLNVFTWYEKSAGYSVTGFNMRTAMAEGRQFAPRRVTLDESYGNAIERIGTQHPIAFAPAGAHAAFDWFAFVDGQLKRTDVLVDPATGRIEGVYPSGLLFKGGGARSWLFPVHSGYAIGPAGGAIMTLMALSLSFWFASGIVIWRRKR